MFQGNFKGDQKMFQVNFKEVSGLCTNYFMDISKKFRGCFKGGSNIFKGVLWVFVKQSALIFFI